MSLVLSFAALAGLFATLSAHFLAVLQILVYAGAIMVLFVFVVMMVNREESTPIARQDWSRAPSGSAAGYGFTGPPGWWLTNARCLCWQLRPRAGEGFRNRVVGGALLFSDFLFPSRRSPFAPGGCHRRGDADPSCSRGWTAGFLMPTYAYILVSLALFFVGTAGVFLRRNALIVLMSVELQLAAGTLALLAFSRALGDQRGHVFAFFVMAVAAAEAAVGWPSWSACSATRRTVSLDDVNALKG